VETLLDAPWDRRPGESAPAFEAFCVYREAGPQRNVRGVATQLGKARSLIFRWSSAHAWVNRASAWDVDRALAERGEDPKVKQARLAHLQRSLQGVMGAFGLAAAEVTRRTQEEPDFLQSLSPRELHRLVHAAARLMPALVKAEQAIVEEGRVHAEDARLLEKELARREVESWSPERREAYLRDVGLLDEKLTSEHDFLDRDREAG
jgi:hypothetical protein